MLTMSLSTRPVPGGGAEAEKKRVDSKEQNISQWFLKHSDAEELEAIIAAREDVGCIGHCSSASCKDTRQSYNLVTIE